MSAPLPKKYFDVHGSKMACYDEGEGTCFVFLHGNPTSSYLWRDVIPPVQALGRCIAPDLIGLGDSDKLPDSGPNRYTIAEHIHYLDALLDQVIPDEPVVLVIHDWGSALGFDWARRHADRVLGIAHMEGITAPLTWDDWPGKATEIFQGFRSAKGEEMVLEKNLFVEAVLPTSIIRKLSDDEMNEYRRPFTQAGESRRPTLTFPRQIPIDGQPSEVNAMVEGYANFMQASAMPKLFVNADPGAIMRGRQREACRAWPNQSEVTVKGIHFIQEDSGAEIGQAIASWYRQKIES